MPTAPRVAGDALFHKVNLKTPRDTSVGNFLNLPGVAMANRTGDADMPAGFLLSAARGQDDSLLGAALAREGLIRDDAAQT